jgi:hypothetical protein
VSREEEKCLQKFDLASSKKSDRLGNMGIDGGGGGIIKIDINPLAPEFSFKF